MEIESVEVTSFKVPTETPECDGTLCWEHTEMVLVQVEAAGKKGLGYTYSHNCLVQLIADTLAPQILGLNPMFVTSHWQNMGEKLRNFSNKGLTQMALGAVDIALWDLKAKLLDVSLFKLLGNEPRPVPLYASGGFTNYTNEQLEKHLLHWKEEGFHKVKIKVGDPREDERRLRLVRETLGDEVELMVDANGAYSVGEAIERANVFAHYGVTWFEEPVVAADIRGTAQVRKKLPPAMLLATGEYGSNLSDFQNLLSHNCADVIQVDVTRCGGITPFIKITSLCEAYNIPVSTHTAPFLHLSLADGNSNIKHMEYFFDHVRIEQMAFECPMPVEGQMEPDLKRPGLGLVWRSEAMDAYKIGRNHVRVN